MSLEDVAKLLFEFPGKKGLYIISTGDLANSGAFLAQAILFPIMNKTGESGVGGARISRAHVYHAYTFARM